MVSKIDTSAVCGHLNATLSGVLPKSAITKVVGKLVNQSPSNYVDTSKELGVIFHNAMQGNFLIDPGEIPHFPCDKHGTYTDRHGNPVSGNHYKEEWINTLLSLPPTSATYRIWAAMTNLKSAGVIEGLSRVEKKEQCEVIRHTFVPNRETRRDFVRFVRKFTPYLVEKLSLDGSREYDILRSIPRSSKRSRYVDKTGELKPCDRGSAVFADLSLALRHPVVNRIFRKYPGEAIAATIIGVDNYQEQPVLNKNMPEPFDHELPVGAAAVVPKDAQKPRTVWILVGALDSLSRPAFHKLEEIESRWNIQGVMDQDGARHHVKSFLSRNRGRKTPKVVSSYDFSAFTDNLSYDYVQRPIVEELVRENILTEFDLELLDEINHGVWEASALGLKYEYLSFGTGDGMGTPPSFPLASVTNGYLVAYSYYKVYGKMPNPTGNNPPGLVVGDDCVIFDEKVADVYEHLCTSIGLKINYDKSFRNDDVAEFCGKYIDADSIYSKRKLIYPSCLDAVRDFITYYDEKVDDYFRAYPELDDSDMSDIIGRMLSIPQPYGSGAPLEGRDLSELTSIEMIAKIAQDASYATNFIPQSQRGQKPRKDGEEEKESDKLSRFAQNVKVSIIRSAEVPPICDPITLTRERDTYKEVPKTNVLAMSLALDVVQMYDAISPTADWEQLYQTAIEISDKIQMIKHLDPPLEDKNAVPNHLPQKKSGTSALRSLLEASLMRGGEDEDPYQYELGD